MINRIVDEVWRDGESDADRIARWVRNAEREIADAIKKELVTIYLAVDGVNRNALLYPWTEHVLRSLGCRWLLTIVEPDRSEVVDQRMKALNMTVRESK